jgi:hypothetical protein
MTVRHFLDATPFLITSVFLVTWVKLNFLRRVSLLLSRFSYFSKRCVADRKTRTTLSAVLQIHSPLLTKKKCVRPLTLRIQLILTNRTTASVRASPHGTHKNVQACLCSRWGFDNLENICTRPQKPITALRTITTWSPHDKERLQEHI